MNLPYEPEVFVSCLLIHSLTYRLLKYKIYKDIILCKPLREWPNHSRENLRPAPLPIYVFLMDMCVFVSLYKFGKLVIK